MIFYNNKFVSTLDDQFRHTKLFLIMYQRHVVPLRQLPLVQCTLSNSLPASGTNNVVDEKYG